MQLCPKYARSSDLVHCCARGWEARKIAGMKFAHALLELDALGELLQLQVYQSSVKLKG